MRQYAGITTSAANDDCATAAIEIAADAIADAAAKACHIKANFRRRLDALNFSGRPVRYGAGCRRRPMRNRSFGDDRGVRFDMCTGECVTGLAIMRAPFGGAWCLRQVILRAMAVMCGGVP